MATNSAPTATFNEALLLSTITGSNFVLKSPTGTTVTATVSYNNTTFTATLTPSASLSNSTTYTATISGVKDLLGDLLASALSWSFTTGPAPTVTSESPASRATGVTVTAPLTATFNEAVQASTIAFTLTNSAGSAIAGSLAYNSTTNTETFTPSAALAFGTSYTATVSGAKDTAGDPMNGSTAWAFTTAASGSSNLTVSAGSAITTTAGATVQFAGAVSGGTAPYTDSWNFGDGATAAGANSATFVQTDQTTTQGNWIGTYGGAGYDIVGDASSYPSYATVTESGGTPYSWSFSTPDMRALQLSEPGASGRQASTWFTGTSLRN